MHETLLNELQKFLVNHAALIATVNENAERLDGLDKTLASIDQHLADLAKAKPEISEASAPAQATEEDPLIQVLEVIRDKGPHLSATLIADAIGKSTWTANEYAKKLQFRGLILRGRGEYRLTKRGKERLREVDCVKTLDSSASLETVKKFSGVKDVRSSHRYDKESEVNPLLASIASACDCKVTDQIGRDLLRHIVMTRNPTYQTMSSAIDRNLTVVSRFLKGFRAKGVITQERIPSLGWRFTYIVNGSALSGHTADCSTLGAALSAPTTDVSTGSNPTSDKRFVFHIREYGKRQGWSEAQFREAFNLIYSVLATMGMDPRGKRNERGHRMSPSVWLEKTGCAGEAYRLAQENFPMTV